MAGLCCQRHSYNLTVVTPVLETKKSVTFMYVLHFFVKKYTVLVGWTENCVTVLAIRVDELKEHVSGVVVNPFS